MSVVFDVLDSLNSIRNVEDLKKRWEIDSKRPDNLSYRAVYNFLIRVLDQEKQNKNAVDIESTEEVINNENICYLIKKMEFDPYCVLNFLINISSFTLRYRTAVQLKKCSLEEQIWIMPYVRYAEQLKSFIAYGDYTLFVPDDFALVTRKAFQKYYSCITEYHNIAAKIDKTLILAAKEKLSDKSLCKELVSLYRKMYNVLLECENRTNYIDESPGEINILEKIIYPERNIYWDIEFKKGVDLYANFKLSCCTVIPFWRRYFSSWLVSGGIEKIDLLNSHFNKNDGSDILDLQDISVTNNTIDVKVALDAVNYFTALEYAGVFNPSAHQERTDLQNLIIDASSVFRVADYAIFENIKKYILCPKMSSKEKLAEIFDICKQRRDFRMCSGVPLEGGMLPENFTYKLQYHIESIFAEYIKELDPDIFTGKAKVETIVETLDFVKEYEGILPEDFFNYLCDRLKESLSITEIRFNERKKVLFEMSHTIKNLLASVSEPLDMLKDQLDGSQRRTVENALAGTGLIRDLAVGIHMSMRGEPGTWRKDVLEPGFGATTLDKIILDAVRHAVSNMFDGKYFAQFVKNYFGRDLNTFMQAQNEWKAAVSAEDTFACINKYFFDFKIDCGESQLNIPIGDRDSTATKLLILFQELFLNAVKYSSFTEREKRFVKLDIAITPQKWHIKLANSAVERQNVKSSGIGLAVIKNFADLFEAKYDANCKNDTYISNINFSLNK